MDDATAAWLAMLLGRLRASGLPGVPARPRRDAVALKTLGPGNYYVVARKRASLAVGLYLASTDPIENERTWDELHREREAIERELGVPLHWNYRRGRLRQYLVAERAFGNAEDAAVPLEWTVAIVSRFHETFTPRLKRLV